MANPAVPGGINYANYPNWEMVTAPSGAVYYKVPNSGYLYDPFLSAQKGRPVLWMNPQPQIDAAEEKKREADRARKRQEDATSPTTQAATLLATTGVGVGGTVLAHELMKDSPTTTTQAPAAKPGSSAAPTNATAKETFVNTATAPGLEGGSNAASPSAAGGVEAAGTGNLRPVGSATMPNGSEGYLMNDGSRISLDGSTVVTPDNVEVVNGQVPNAEPGVDYGQYLGYAAAIYSAYNTYKNRDKLTSEQEAAGYAQAASTAYQAYAGANPYLAGAAAAYNVYSTYDNDDMTAEMQAARAQQQLGAAALDYFIFPGLGTALDAGLQSTGFGRDLTEFNAKYSPISQALASFGSSKSAEQMGRDKVRERLEGMGVINQEGEDDWMLRFSDGTEFDLGKDGGARITNAAGETRQYSDVDFTDPRVGAVVGAVNPLAAILTGGNEKLRSDFAGEYTNAVLNGPDDPASVNRRLQELYTKHNLNQSDAIKQIDSLLEEERIDNETAAAYRNGVNTVFSGTAYNGPAAQPVQPPAAPAPMQLVKPIAAAGPQGQAVMNQTQPPGGRLPVQQDPAQAAYRGAGVVQNPNPQQAAYTTVPRRTTTLSPGIGLDGKPIVYGRELAKRADQRSARR